MEVPHRVDTNFRSASVMPYYYNEQEQEAYYLVGKGFKRWSDFGGFKDREECQSYVTAARKIYEETLGVFLQIDNKIRENPERIFSIKVQNHVTYIVALNVGSEQLDNPFHFEKAARLREDHKINLQQPGLKPCQKAKKEIAWIKASDLFEYLAPNLDGTSFTYNLTLYEAPEQGAAKILNQQMRLCMGKALREINGSKQHFCNGFIDLIGKTI